MQAHLKLVKFWNEIIFNKYWKKTKKFPNNSKSPACNQTFIPGTCNILVEFLNWLIHSYLEFTICFQNRNIFYVSKTKFQHHCFKYYVIIKGEKSAGCLYIYTWIHTFINLLYFLTTLLLLYFVLFIKRIFSKILKWSFKSL